jgi:hypothetical protein
VAQKRNIWQKPLFELEEKSSYEDQTRFAGSRIGVISLVAAAILALSACASCDKLPRPPATSASPSPAPATKRVLGPLFLKHNVSVVLSGGQMYFNAISRLGQTVDSGVFRRRKITP